jgi:hypothetical protein
LSIEQAVMEKLRALPFERQQQLLDFVDFLGQKAPPRRPLRSVKGLLADLDIHITDDDIAQARKEMWGSTTNEAPSPQ